MIWGDPIEVNGVRPAWLHGDQEILYLFLDLSIRRDWVGPTRTDGWSSVNPFRLVGSIKLPADHFAYLAIAKGFEPWGGEDIAPEDWDHGPVLTDESSVGTIYEGYNHDWSGESRVSIIGYKRKQAFSDGDYVSVKRMTLDEAFAFQQANADLRDWPEWKDCMIALGLIIEPTQAETIATKTGLTVDQVQSVLNEVNNGTR